MCFRLHVARREAKAAASVQCTGYHIFMAPDCKDSRGEWNDETHCMRLRSSDCLSNINATLLRHCVRVSPQGLSKQCHAGHNQYVSQTSYVAAFCILRLIVPICPQHESIHNSRYMRPGPGPGLWFREAIDSLAKPDCCSSLVAKLEPCLAACGSRDTGVNLPRNFVTRLYLPVGVL